MPKKETNYDYVFGQFRLTPAKRRLRDSSGNTVTLRGKIYDLLWHLIQHRGRLVSKSELMEALWPETVVEENNLNQTVSALRQALDDDARTPSLIATVKGRGYQFVGDVDVAARTVRQSQVASTNSSTTGSHTWPVLLLSMAIAILLAVFAFNPFERKPSRTLEYSATEALPSIAVLPFENRSIRATDSFFADGIHDDILTSLAKIRSIKVISRTSVAQFRNPNRVIPDIAAELGASAVLEGAVQRVGDSVRINVQLIDAATDAHIWAESYDRELTVENIFAIQSEISNTIAVALHAELSAQERIRIYQMPTESLAAYEAYLLGNQKLQRRTAAALEEARVFFQKAISLDPEFALAYVGLADSYLILLTYSNRKWAELEPPARAAVEKAIELDESLGEAYATLAMINTESGDHDVAGTQFRRSISLSPNYETAYHWYASHFFRTGRMQSAVEQISIAVSLDPLSPILRFSLASYHQQLGQYEDSKIQLAKAIEIDPRFARGYWGLANVYHQVDGDLVNAAISAKKALDRDSAVPSHYTLLAAIFSDVGDEEEAARWLEKAAELDSDGINYVVTALHLAMLRGDREASTRLSQRYVNFHSRSIMVAIPAVNDYLEAGRFEEAIDILEPRIPIPDADQANEITNRNLIAAVALTHVYQRAGSTLQSRRLLKSITAYLDSPSFITYSFFKITQVQILTLQGKKADALAALRRHAESGWRFQANYHLNFDPILDSIRDEPEFIAIANDIRTDIATQRESLRLRWEEEFGQ